jgi:hypothetical protein
MGTWRESADIILMNYVKLDLFVPFVSLQKLVGRMLNSANWTHSVCSEVTVWHSVYQMLSSTALLTRSPHLNSVQNSVNVNAGLLPSKHSWWLNGQQHNKQTQETKEEVTRLTYNTSVCLSVCLFVCLTDWLTDWLTGWLAEWLTLFLSDRLSVFL